MPDICCCDGHPGDLRHRDRQPAVITGAYSLTYQASSWPAAALHPAHLVGDFGQIYIPASTRCCSRAAAAGFTFQTASKLAHATHRVTPPWCRRADRLHRGVEAVEWKWWSAALLLVPW